MVLWYINSLAPNIVRDKCKDTNAQSPVQCQCHRLMLVPRKENQSRSLGTSSDRTLTILLTPANTFQPHLEEIAALPGIFLSNSILLQMAQNGSYLKKN